MGCDAKLNDKKAIKEFDNRVAEVWTKGREVMTRLYEKRMVQLPSVPIEQAVSEHFNVFVFPQVGLFRKLLTEALCFGTIIGI